MKLVALIVSVVVALGSYGIVFAASETSKPSPEAVVQMLKDGNERFAAGKSLHEHTDISRLKQAGSENQGEHAYATVLTCSDSRVPVERIFDAGIMDIFVVRVAGNVVKTDEAGSIEYGLAHVHTPVLVVLGHTQCGAVKAVADTVQGHGHEFERNIPPLVAPIIPAVERAMRLHPDASAAEVVQRAIEENVWQGIEDLFMQSPAVREMVGKGQVVVVGAIYDVGVGTIEWLPVDTVGRILSVVEQNPERAMNVMAGKGRE
jgi:carbonic anhydrase